MAERGFASAGRGSNPAGLSVLLAPDGDGSLAWFREQLARRRLRPICQVGYHRIARVSRSGRTPMRLTLDTDIRALRARDVSFGQTPGVPVLLDGQQILELKFQGPMPELFRALTDAIFAGSACGLQGTGSRSRHSYQSGRASDLHLRAPVGSSADAD